MQNDDDPQTNAEAILNHEIRATICREHRRGLSNRAIAGGVSTIFNTTITESRVKRVLDEDLRMLNILPQDVLQAAIPPIEPGQTQVAAKELDLKAALREKRQQEFNQHLPPSPHGVPHECDPQSEDSFEVAPEDIQPHILAALNLPNEALRYQVFTLRKQGKSYPEIQSETGIDQSLARKWVKDELAVLDMDELSNRDLARRMQLERTEALMSAIWPAATRQPTEEFPNQGPDLEATRTALRILERQSKLLGLDSPPKVDIEERVRRMARKYGVDEEEMVGYAIEAVNTKILPSR